MGGSKAMILDNMKKSNDHLEAINRTTMKDRNEKRRELKNLSELPLRVNSLNNNNRNDYTKIKIKKRQ